MSKLFDELSEGLNEVEAYLAGKREGFRVTVPAEIDVRLIRKRLKMTQAEFSRTFGFSLDAVKHWEGGRRTPEAAARAFLTVISRNPVAVMDALDAAPARERKTPARRSGRVFSASKNHDSRLKRTA
jgi:putative transcriptional regulator